MPLLRAEGTMTIRLLGDYARFYPIRRRSVVGVVFEGITRDVSVRGT